MRPAEALVLLALIVVMLIVPWILARQSPPGDAAHARSGLERPPGSLFSSEREKRLWLWALAVLVAIYSTLGPVQELATWLRERNLLRVSTSALLLVVGATIAVRWARTRPGRREVGVALGVTAVYLTALIRMPIPEERTHLFEYGLVAILIYHALTERRRNDRRVPAPAVLAVAATALLGWIDEGIQSLLPSRVYDLRDVGFNALALLMAIVSSLLLARARRKDVV